MQHGTTRADVVELVDTIFIKIDREDRQPLKTLGPMHRLTDDNVLVSFIPSGELDWKFRGNQGVTKRSMTREYRDVREWKRVLLKHP